MKLELITLRRWAVVLVVACSFVLSSCSGDPSASGPGGADFCSALRDLKETAFSSDPDLEVAQDAYEKLAAAADEGVEGVYNDPYADSSPGKVDIDDFGAEVRRAVANPESAGVILKAAWLNLMDGAIDTARSVCNV